MDGKVLSVKQPWADMLVYGMKRIEIRTWKTNHRGQVYIHASKKMDDVPFLKRYFYGTKPHDVGMIIGYVTLINCKKYTSQKEFDEDIPKHHNLSEWYREGLYGWEFIEPCIFTTGIPCKGQLGLFNREV